MTDEFKSKFRDFESSTANLSAVLRKEYSDLERDGLIKRFELTFETCWKALKVYVTEAGIQNVKSPRDAFKAAFRLDLINDERLWEEILKFRNLAVHTYDQGLAEDVVHELPRYYPEFQKLVEKLKNLTEQ